VNVWPPTVIVLCRVCGSVLAAAEKNTVPLPLPPAPAVIDNHVAPLEADHTHPAGAVTAVDPVPPVAATEALTGRIANEHPAAAWFTVNVCPPITIDPSRGVVVVFAAAANVTVPLPSPFAPPVTDSHAGVQVVADHVQPVDAVTVVVPLVAPDAIETLAGESEYVHGAAD